MATHSSLLAWIIPWTEGPVGLHSTWNHKELDTTEQLKLSLFFQYWPYKISWDVPFLVFSRGDCVKRY